MGRRNLSIDQSICNRPAPLALGAIWYHGSHRQPRVIPVTILVFNSGSSSLKFRLYATGGEHGLDAITTGAITGFSSQATWTWRESGDESRGQIDAVDHRAAARWVLARLRARSQKISAIGHRVVHGGEMFTQPTRITADVVAGIDALSKLAPVHNPPALEVISACREFFSDGVPMIAVFDTAFHAAMPEAARRYALPEDWVRAYGIRRYGFHGLAHRSMVERFRLLNGTSPANSRVITLQLGHGCSVAAICDGSSVDTSMGFTPLEGLIMATRSGDVDPGVLIRLASEGIEASELDRRLNHESGLLALSGVSDDMRTLLTLEAQGHEGARFAIEAFCRRARKYVGAYLALLGGADAVLFGGGIGEHAPIIRERICAGMQWCGMCLDERVNAESLGVERLISTRGTRPAVYTIRVDEELLIARDTAEHLLLR